MPLYSSSMPLYSPGNPESASTKKRRLHSGKTKPKFPSPPVDIPLQKSRSKYDYLLHDPRTIFARVPSSFLHGEDSVCLQDEERALQTGTKPEDISYYVAGHVLSCTMETVNTYSFFFLPDVYCSHAFTKKEEVRVHSQSY